MTSEEETFVTGNEFRSDTFTVPTRSMISKSMETTTFGDSVYKEDDVTLKLEQKMMELTGKSAALFCVSGTMSNQIALRANLVQPPYSVLCDSRAHVFLHEAGGLATLSQAMVHPVIPLNGCYLTLDDILSNYTADDGDIHAAPTKVVSLENTLHGIITPIEEIEKISAWCRSENIKLHLDGARIWNASSVTGVSIKQYCQYFDSISLCLSKSLGAPMGLVLVGNQQFINKANHYKKQVGGGIRQAGILTSMAIVAIDENFDKLKQAHAYAKYIGDFCNNQGIKLQSPVDSNFVFIDLKANFMNDSYLIELGEKYNVKLMGGRLAFHFQNDWDSVKRLKSAIEECFNYSKTNPYIIDSKNNKKMYNYNAMQKELNMVRGRSGSEATAV